MRDRVYEALLALMIICLIGLAVVTGINLFKIRAEDNWVIETDIIVEILDKKVVERRQRDTTYMPIRVGNITVITPSSRTRLAKYCHIVYLDDATGIKWEEPVPLKDYYNLTVGDSIYVKRYSKEKDGEMHFRYKAVY